MEYWIQAVRYFSWGPIDQVRVVPATLQPAGSNPRYKLGDVQDLARSTVASWITTGYATFFTATYDPSSGFWNKGAEVKVSTDNQFITTVGDRWVYNNLESLPRF